MPNKVASIQDNFEISREYWTKKLAKTNFELISIYAQSKAKIW